MAHPYASQAKASQKRRLSALGAKAGKSFGSSNMYKKTSYPSKNAGTEREMTISGKTAGKRADRFASGGVVSAGGKPKAKPKAHSTTNIVIANGGGGRRGNRNRGGGMPIPVPVNRPVPVPVPVGGAGALPPRPPIALAGGPPGMPPGPPPGLPSGIAGPMAGPPPGMASGGLAGASYHNWGEGYKKGGFVKKGAPGEKIEKKAGGGRALRGVNQPMPFKGGAVPGQPPVVPLSGKAPGGLGNPLGRVGMKKGGKAKKYQDGGDVDEDKENDSSGFDLKETQKGLKDLSTAIDPAGSKGVYQARAAENLADRTMAGNEAGVRKLGKLGGAQAGGFKPGALPGSSSGFKKGGKVPSSHSDEAQDRKLIKSMLAKEEKAEKYAGGGFVPKNEKSKDSALIGSTYRNQGTGFNKGGVVKKAGSHSGLGRLQKISAAKAVPAKTEI